MKQIGIVICNYNKAEALDLCIRSVLESGFPDFDVYVVDNASEDRSLHMLHEKYEDKVRIVENKENLGGSGGFNAGLRKAMEQPYPYLMCIDNDAFLDENAIGNLYGFLEEHEECGVACAKVFHLENPDVVQQYGIEIDFDDFCVRSPYEGRMEDGTLPAFVYCDAVPACAMMVRRSVIEKIGVLPEENFLYWDDTEWCYCCNQAGFRVACVGNAQALHAMGAKKETVNTFPTYYAWRNWLRFFLKFTPQEDMEKLCEKFLNSLFVMIYESMYNGEDGRVKTVMAAYDDALHGVTGKAAPGIIEKLNNRDERLQQMLKTFRSFQIISNGYQAEAELMRQRLTEAAREQGILPENEAAFAVIDKEAGAECTIALCDYIFQVEDLSRNVIYTDVDSNILLTEEDVYWVMNYGYGLDTFLRTQKDLFLRLAENFREEFKKNTGFTGFLK